MDIENQENIDIELNSSVDINVETQIAGPPGPRGEQGVPGPQGEPGRDGVIQYNAGDNITIENNTISAIQPDLSSYATKEYVNNAIENAITDTLGGSY